MPSYDASFDSFVPPLYLYHGLAERHERLLNFNSHFSSIYDSVQELSLPSFLEKSASFESQFPLRRPLKTARPTRLPLHLRTLTGPSSLRHYEMTTSATLPASPPELTSSKSSSFHSSSLSGADGIASDLSHFEDIGLNDGNLATTQDLYRHNRSNSARPSPSRNGSATTNGSRNDIGAVSGTRELVNGSIRPTFPSLYGQVRSAVGHTVTQSLSLPHGQTLRKGIASPLTPSLAMTAMRNRSRSRSPSPTHPQNFSPSPHSLPGSATSLRPRASPVIRRSTSRTGSWQPGRKSAKELEDEYHDSDEDLPDDASLWNVPLSPALYRTTSTAASSANPSPSTSPERPSRYNRSPGRDHNARRSIHTAPTGTQQFRGTLASVPASPVPPGLTRGASTGMMPDHFGFPKVRAKSWTVALSELSEEAKSLSEALEAHAFESERQHEVQLQSGVAAARPSMEKLTRARTSVLELPPLRKSNIMIDPLPISKEKEKVLSRTRPSWLPPKNPKEEKKHLKEYQRMMELSLEADKRKATQAASLRCARDDTKVTLLRIWEEHVIPNWGQAIREPRTRELWWRGIAPHSRAQVWTRAIGNELAITEATFTKALQRAKAMEKEINSQQGGDERKEKAWFAAIRRDVDTTFPSLKMFQLGRPLHGALTDLLMAYSMYRSDVGYSYCTQLPSALLLLVLPSPSLAFTLLANILNRPLPLAFLTGDNAGMTRTYDLILKLLATKFPRLHTHLFTNLALSPGEILEPMIRSFFLYRGCPETDTDETLSPRSVVSLSSATSHTGRNGPTLDLVARVWDVMVFDGDTMLIRTCVAILGCLESSLYGNKEDVMGVLGWEGSMGASRMAEMNEDEFMEIVRDVGKEEKKKQAHGEK
ncbi:hypothetical protein MMC13_003268 [Lambiella insularis]|nr:hypothetical protein [Lambiella insularis]